MIESWYKVWCPICNKINWFCNGDESDLSEIDVTAIKCRSCGHIWALEEEMGDDLDVSQDIRKEEWNYEIGLEIPK